MSCKLKVDKTAELLSGRLEGVTQASFHGVSTDTRAHLKGKLFVGLKGENFDGNEFCEQAIQAGAAALLVNEAAKLDPKYLSQVSVIRVADTLLALQQLALVWRSLLKGTVVGITGSNGKSSTKDFCYQIIKSSKKVHVAQKSYNNHIGVPLTLLDAPLDSEVILVEMGMNHSGELTSLSKIAKPNVVLCTMVGRSHIGNFENGIQGIADAKEEIYLANPKAIKIFNCDNEYTMKMYERAQKTDPDEQVKTFSSFSAGAEVSLRAQNMELESLLVTGHIKGIKGEQRVPLFGRHNIVNLMAASSVAIEVGMEPEAVWKEMAHCHSAWGRNQLHKLKSGTKIIFDGYNSNPDSLSSLVKNIFEIYVPDGKKVAVIAEMLELGEGAEPLHEQLGELIGQVDFSVVWFFGKSHQAFERGVKKAGFSKNLIISDTYKDSLALKVQGMLNPSDVVVMKGSRGSQVERVLKQWDPSFTKN